MSFATFSDEFSASLYTSVENQFITKYLPQAEGDAVRAYLYGLYLCSCKEQFDAESAAKLLRISKEKLVDIFCFWEECDLVHVLSKDPLFVEYLPVSAAVGKPKSVRPEKYAEFNRALYKLLQRADKDFKPFELQRILEFLEREPMEQQAFLLVVEYCVKKDGNRLTCAHILNKAEKLCRERKYTYEQVEADLADFNEHERELSRIFTLLGISRKPQDADYAFLGKWLSRGLKTGALYAAAEALGKGSLRTLDLLADELAEHGAFTEEAAREYLKQRAELADIVFRTARKLGVKVENPRPYAEQYAQKWTEHGYDGESLSLLASLCLKFGYGFEEMDQLIDRLYAAGTVDIGSVKQYCSEQDKRFRLLQRIQGVCGVIKKSESALDMIATWRSWDFSDEMIFEAAKRGANASAPLPYMNKLLSEWKRLGVKTAAEIPQREAPSEYRKETAIAEDGKIERERFYAELRRRALEKAEKAKEQAERNAAYREANALVRKAEIELAKAEVYSPEKTEGIATQLGEAKKARLKALASIGLSEGDLLPSFRCKKCSDTGYMPDGRLCDCYKRAE